MTKYHVYVSNVSGHQSFAFVLTGAGPEGSIESLYIYFETDDVESHPSQEGDLSASLQDSFLFGSYDLRWWPPMSRRGGAGLSGGRPELLLHVNPNLPFPFSCSSGTSFSLCYSFFSLSLSIKQPDIVLAASHYRVCIAAVPLFKAGGITWLVLVQSAQTGSVIGLNKRAQNRPQPVPSGPLLFLLLPCMETSALIPTEDPRINTSCWYSWEKGQPTREQDTNGSCSSGAYLHVIYFLMFSLREEFRPKHLSTAETRASLCAELW